MGVCCYTSQYLILGACRFRLNMHNKHWLPSNLWLIVNENGRGLASVQLKSLWMKLAELFLKRIFSELFAIRDKKP